MKTIYKYPIPLISAEFDMELPVGAVILSFQIQNKIPCIWAMIDKDADKEQRHFRFYATGYPIVEISKDLNLHYIGTVQTSGGLVWHLFEIGKNFLLPT